MALARTKEFDHDVALDRAMHLFWRQGYEATSIQDLVEHMGIGRGSLYATFGDRHTLYIAAFDRYCATVGAGFLAPLAEPIPVCAALRRVFDGVVAESLAEGHHGCLMANGTLELASHDGDVRRRVELGLQGAEDTIARALALAQATGELAAGRDPRALEDIARATLSALDRPFLPLFWNDDLSQDFRRDQ